ncbi:hypothetical protein NHQ30_006084 [Ciborinia camelliae]|nr:hypothetical protein NHQ30_006084 [Ciborinia camelliae]
MAFLDREGSNAFEILILSTSKLISSPYNTTTTSEYHRGKNGDRVGLGYQAAFLLARETGYARKSNKQILFEIENPIQISTTFYVEIKDTFRNSSRAAAIASQPCPVVNYPQEQYCYNSSKTGVIQLGKSPWC